MRKNKPNIPCTYRGKRFNQSLKILGINYKNEKILYDYQKNNDDYDKISAWAKYLFYSPAHPKQINIKEGIALLKKLYVLIDDALKQFIRYAPCKPGCNACCHMIVDATAIETEYIKTFIKTNLSKPEIITLQNKINNMLHLYPDNSSQINDGYREKFFQKNIPCVFLDEHNYCLIYPARPIHCRTHLVFSHPKNCSPGKYNIEYQGGITELAEKGVLQLASLIENKMSHRNGQFTPIVKPLPKYLLNLNE